MDCIFLKPIFKLIMSLQMFIKICRFCKGCFYCFLAYLTNKKYICCGRRHWFQVSRWQEKVCNRRFVLFHITLIILRVKFFYFQTNYNLFGTYHKLFFGNALSVQSWSIFSTSTSSLDSSSLKFFSTAFFGCFDFTLTSAKLELVPGCEG